MQDSSARVCDLVWHHWRAGTVIDGLPGHLKPRTRADGYAAQALLARRSAHPRAGWKIAATSVAGQRHIAVDGPMAGRLLAESIREDGATLSIATNRMRVAEPEFAFRFGEAVPARSEPYSVEEACASRMALLFDSGVRRGADIVRARALGAAFSLAGRAFAYGAAAGGEAGVASAFEILKTELVRALGQLGRPAFSEVGPAALAAASALDLSPARTACGHS